MHDPRAAWHAEQQRQRRARRAYWLGIGEAYLILFLGTQALLGVAMLVRR